MISLSDSIKNRIIGIWQKKNYLYYTIPFIAIDLATKALLFKKRSYPIYQCSSVLFTLVWIALFGIIIFTFKGIVRQIIYWALFGICFIMMLVNGIYYFKTDFFHFIFLKQLVREVSIF